MIRSLILRGAIAVGVLAAAGGAIALPMTADPHAPRPLLTKASSPLVHANSRDGSAVLRASNMKPGDARTGEVTIANRGGADDMYLVARPGSGRLADRLVLSIDDLSTTRSLVAEGRLSAAPRCLPLGTYAPRESRTYRFDVAFPSRADDNSYAGLSANVDFEWVEGDEVPEQCLRGPRSPAGASNESHSISVGDMRLAVAPGPYRFSRRTGTAKLGIRCISSRSGRCAGTLEMERRRRGQGRGLEMARATFSMRAGTTRKVTVRLNSRARKRVTSTGSVPVRAYVTARDARGRRVRAAYRDKLVYGVARKHRR